MNIIHDLHHISDLSHPGIVHILTRRISELRPSTEEALTDIGEFIVVEPGDTIADLEEASECAITTDLFDEVHYGAPDFMPAFEWLEHHQVDNCYEMVFIMSDDGHFTVFLIPDDDPGIDPQLLALCREYS